jgi:hypothetical protein
MSSFLMIAVAAAVPFVAPLPASMSSWGPAYLLLFGAALFKAGSAIRRPTEASRAHHPKEAWSRSVAQSSVTSV